ncbi:hypothetical protein LCGC14_0939510 [marine sediment metagenome]|uniref:Uncharacterized protein n=1 Tax=marine sediment metagenome TaxID=412755 RepID=A0A0F9P6N0_9ZZZZ
MGSGMRLRKYGVQATIDFEVFEVDGVDLRVDWTPAQADCEIMKDGGASTLCDNTATDEGSTYSIVLTATEMQFARGVLKIVDAATKVFLDTVVHIETYGNASAQHAFDLDTATQDVNATQISGDTTAADKLEAMLDGMTTGVVETSGSNSSTQVQTDLAEATNDHYDVMTILFTSGAEAGQSRLITGYAGSSGTVSWNAALTGTPADGSKFIILAAGTTADAVWDEILTGSSHNISTSAGKRLRQIEEAFVHASGVIATVTNGHTFTLDAGAVATADYYVGDRLQLVEGTGAGQSRIIVAYTFGKVVTLDSDFTTNPDTSTLYEVNAADVHVSLSDADQAQGFVATYTNTTTITLDTAAVGITDYYLGSLIVFTHGTGAGQVREITGYTSGRVVTMSPALATALDTTTVWHVQAAISAAVIVDEWELQSQADPTGFHVNIKEVNGTAQTANDNSADINAILTDTGTDGVVLKAAGLNADAVDEILDEEVDNDGTAITLRGAIKLILSILTAKSSGGGSATLVFRDVNDSKNRLSCTVDANGNRTAVGTRDAS